jgi:aspartate aminotransferase-like enzyme
MIEDRIVLSPGPVHVSPSAWASIRPLHHRSDEFMSIVRETERMIRELLETDAPVYTITASGTGGMEFAVANLTRPGSKVLVVAGGKFGDRWSEICGAYGCRVHHVRLSPGKEIDVDDVVRRVAANRPDILALTHVESSTGMRVPIEALIGALPEPRPLVMIDAIASVGVESFSMGALGIDAAVAASQKAFAAPPGVSFVALSPRARESARTAKNRHRYYLSLERYEEGRERGYTPFTPAIHTIQIMYRSLRTMREVGWERVRNRHRAAARACIEAARHMSLESFPDNPSDAVQAFAIPASYGGPDLVSDLAEREGVIVAGGQGPLRGRLIRIGFLGIHGGRTLERAVGAMARILAEGGCAVDREAALEAIGAVSDREDLF